VDDSLSAVDLDHALFFDTETTGLAGGSGTIPFLLGLAWYNQGRFQLQQYFLRDLGQEGPMLKMLADRINQSSCIVTYNGKSFDWPLVRNRFIMHRIPVPREPLHLDLLHCARRVFKRNVKNARLVAIEEQVLGFERIDDVAGADIAEHYFSFLRGEPGVPVDKIIEHNAHDLISLAAILIDLDQRYMGREGSASSTDLSLAELAIRVGDIARAQRFLDQVLDAEPSKAHRVEALVLRADLALRDSNYDQSRDSLEQALRLCGSRAKIRPQIQLRLAKLYEHRLRVYPKAIKHARGASQLEGASQSHRRLNRLAIKLDRANS
jgi:tetratricopeptide (TPR) repeat protein